MALAGFCFVLVVVLVAAETPRRNHLLAQIGAS